MQRYLITSLFIALISGCSAIGNNIDFLSVHKIDVQQGNIITDDMIELLRPGLTEDQVQYVMGTPLLIDTFNPNHWDYVYRYLQGDGQVEERRVRVVFKQGRVSSIEQ